MPTALAVKPQPHRHPEDPPPLADVLDLAADLVDTYGLARHRFAAPGGRVSATGAVQRAFQLLGGHRAHFAELTAAEGALAEEVGGRVESWSDEATEEEVVVTLQAAASTARRAARSTSWDW